MSWPISSPGSSARVCWDRFQYGCYFEISPGSLIQTTYTVYTVILPWTSNLQSLYTDQKSASHKTDLTFVRRVTAHLIGLHSFQTQWSASPDKEMEGIGKEERSAVLSPSVTDEKLKDGFTWFPLSLWRRKWLLHTYSVLTGQVFHDHH